MDKTYWMMPGMLAGRPGPDRVPWDPRRLFEGGIRAILSVNDGLLVHPEGLAQLGILHACFPLADNAPPREGDAELCRVMLPPAYRFTVERIGEGRPVLVHCSSGKDRTGLFLSYFLVRSLKLSPTDAISRVREVRPIALSATGWEEFARAVLSSLP